MSKRKKYDARARFRKVMTSAVFYFDGSSLSDIRHKTLIFTETHKAAARLGAWSWSVDLGEQYESYLAITQPCYFEELVDIVQCYCAENDMAFPEKWSARVTR